MAKKLIARQRNLVATGFDAWFLGMEASAVIAMRMAKFATLDLANMAEAQLMIAEKIEAAADIQMKALTGKLGKTPEMQARRTIAHYRRAVKKNRRRLSQ